MKTKISKTNENLAYFNGRLDEIRMSGHERLKAKAHLARAEAVADATAALINLVMRLLKTLVVRPIRRLTTSIG